MAIINDPDGLSQGTENSVAATTFASASGAQITITSANVPVVAVNDYIEVRDATNAANDGLYRVDTYNAGVSIVATKQALTGSVINPANDAGSQTIRIFGDSTAEKNIYFDTTNRLFTFLNGYGSVTVLDDFGVFGQALYSFMKEEWKNDNDLIKFPFPMTAITPEQFEFNEWRPVDEADTGNTISTTDPSDTRDLLRNCGWDEVSAAGFILKQRFGLISLGNIDNTDKQTGDRPYYFYTRDDGSFTASTSTVFAGEVNEGIESITNIEDTAGLDFATATTITRTASWVGDVAVGDTILIQNAANSANNGNHIVTGVATSTLTFAASTFTTGVDAQALVAVDRRGDPFTLRLRVFGKTYDQSSSNAIGVTTLTNQAYRFPLSEGADAVITDLGVSFGDANGGAVPYSDMSIAYFAAAQTRSGFTGGTADFGVIIDGDVSVPQEDGGGVASAEEIYAYVQARLTVNGDINDGSGGAAVVVNGQQAEPLVSLASTGNTMNTLFQTNNLGGDGGGVYVDSFSGADKNRIIFNDNASSTSTVQFPLTVVVTINFNNNLTDDVDAVFRTFFTNDDAGDNLGRDFGTIDAITVQDDTLTDIAGAIPGAQANYNYAYDGNVQRGAGSGSTPVPITIVAIGLGSAQYVVATGTITDTGLTASLVAALERNYSNPA